MIEWQLNQRSFDIQEQINLTDLHYCDIKETDFIQFKVCINEELFNEIGDPQITTSDAPIEMKNVGTVDGNIIFESNFDLNSYESQIFYNYFGLSEVSLCFERDLNLEYLKVCRFNILVRKANADLAEEMLSFLSKHADDSINICFSRSKVASGLSNESQSTFSKIDRIKQIVHYMDHNYSRFYKEKKYNWFNTMSLSESGCPTGPDSIYWALTNLDQLSPSIPEESNVVFNNRNYRFNQIPSEYLEKDYDVFENRVIMSFFKFALYFLAQANQHLDSWNEPEEINSDYIRFDDLLATYTKQLVQYKLQEYKLLEKKVYELKIRYQRVIPAKDNPITPPKLTNYARKHPHYHHLFQLIELGYKSPPPNLNGGELLHGLKNLSTVYEVCSLMLITNILESDFNMTLLNSEYRIYDRQYGFFGKKEERPEYQSNNYFVFRGDNETIEIFYEPKIYQISQYTKAGDLINISNKKDHPKYGPHYYKPDFVLRITSILRNKVSAIVLDAKYKHSKNVEIYDLDGLVNKYLLHIHQFNEDKTVTPSPIKVVMALFAHDTKDKIVSNIAKIHRLDGEYPVFPSILGVHFSPSNTAIFKKQLQIALSAINSYC